MYILFHSIIGLILKNEIQKRENQYDKFHLAVNLSSIGRISTDINAPCTINCNCFSSLPRMHATTSTDEHH